MLKQLLASTALATALILSPAMAQENGDDSPGASGFAPGQMKGEGESARGLAPGQQAQDSEDPDDTGRDFAPGQLMLEEEDEDDDDINDDIDG